MKQKLNKISILLLLGIIFCTGAWAQGEKPEAYLFSYFIGNGPGEEAVFYAISKDGFTYYGLNDHKAVIHPDSISQQGGVRDPHILRGNDGKTFYMVLTDLYVPNDGWQNTGMVMLKSTDLVNWAHSKVQIPEVFPNKFGEVRRVWAPQTIYDPKVDQYMLYWSMQFAGEPDIIYYAYANDDFTGLATEPKQLFYHPEMQSTIDGDIVYHDGKYHLFFKTEGHGDGIKKAVSDQLTEGYVMQDRYLHQTKEAVEGSGIFKLNDSDKYILMYDVYKKGSYQFTESNDLENFTIVDDQIKMDFHPRHGSVLPITQYETARLLKTFGIPEGAAFLAAASGELKTHKVKIEKGEAKLLAKDGADISSLDPKLKVLPGLSISPQGPQDFSGGAVDYTIQVPEGISRQVKVGVQRENNPVLPDVYADPHIAVFGDTYYIYPTTDGYEGWASHSFTTWSSKDLKNWKSEGVILDLKKDISWTDERAWAPAIAEKNGKYYYYFSADVNIGVAVADSPTGPFIDPLGRPLVSRGEFPNQMIDPMVLVEDDGSAYLYWGQGKCHMVKLNDDMISFDKSKVIVFKPEGYNEGAFVFKRNGTYYLMWSEYDTRDPRYSVAYGTSDSPLGPFTKAADNPVLKGKGIIEGAGHHSVVQVPGKDEWYIAYHRFRVPGGNGYNRETAISPMRFDEEGRILPVDVFESVD